jgi:hypothetical protein
MIRDLHRTPEPMLEAFDIALVLGAEVCQIPISKSS